MSDPLSKHEIEDVLSSIRRLVSEELRPLQAGGGGDQGVVTAPIDAPPLAVLPAQRPDAPQPEVGKLLLTPSLRVVDPAPEPDVEPPLDEAVVVAAGGWQLDALADPLLPPDLSVTADRQPALAPILVPDAAPSLADEIAAFWEVQPDEKPVPDHYDDAALELGGSGLRAVLAVVGTPEDEVRPDDLLWAAAGQEDEAGPAAEPAVAAAAPLRLQDLAPDWDKPAPGAEEGLWAGGDAEWQEDEPVAFVAHPRPHLVTPPVVEPATARADAQDGDALHGDAPAQAGADDGLAARPAIDEELLRSMVREIVRQELAGSMGERITRNVRKLVRHEVNQALTLRNFD